MTAPSHYYEGLLAAVRPHEQRAAAPSPSEPPSLEENTSSAPDENLSWEELVKRRLHPLDSFVRLLDCAVANRPPDADDRFRFRWFGLFYQAPDQDAFTLRLRLPGGRIKPWQLAALADLTQRHAGGQILCNARGGLDVPGVPITSVVDALTQVKSIGFDPWRTGGDCVQAIRGGELDASPDQSGKHVPVYPMVCALEQACSLSPTLSDLPSPCEIMFAGEHENVGTQRPPAIDTIVLRLSKRVDAALEKGEAASPEPSFLLYSLGDTHGFRLTLRQVVPACLELLKSWATKADRSSRDAASLRKFAADGGFDAPGVLPGGAQRERLPLEPTPEDSADRTVTPDGRPVPDGRLLSGQLMELDRLCQAEGWSEIRISHNHLYAVGSQGQIADATDRLGEALTV